jgi:hypothetical protein
LPTGLTFGSTPGLPSGSALLSAACPHDVQKESLASVLAPQKRPPDTPSGAAPPSFSMPISLHARLPTTSILECGIVPAIERWIEKK